MPERDPVAGMSRDIQQKLADALVVAEDLERADMARIGHFRGDARAAATPQAAGAACPLPPAGLSPFWLFCRPIEDLLGDEPLPLNSTRMPPAVPAACWQVIAERISPARHTSVAAELAAHVAGETFSGDAIMAVGARWWSDCERALSAEIADTRSGGSWALAERSPKYLLEHAETIAAALSAAQSVERLKRLLGEPPIARLGPTQQAAVRNAIEEIARRCDARVAVYVIAHRMQNPAEWLALTADLRLGRITGQGQALSDQREAVVLSHAAAQLAALEDPIVEAADLAAAVDRAEAAAGTLSTGLELAAHGVSADFLRDVARLQKALGDQLHAAVIPAVRSASAAAWEVSADEASPAAVLAAEDAARAMARLARSAALIGAESAFRPVVSDMIAAAEAAIDQTAASSIVEPSIDRASWCAARLVGAARFIETLAGSDRAFAVLAGHRPLLETLWGMAAAI
jgi:hypothetical protein